MSGPAKRVEPAELEAAQWHARLGASPVSSDTIEAFFAWRQLPANADAYRRVETAWSSAEGLAGDPLIEQAREAAMSRSGKTGTGASLKAAATALGGAVAACVLITVAWNWVDGRGVYATAVGEQRSVQLADGSSVRLDTGSRVRVRFDGESRWIDLEQGQALFTVAHDSRRPFVVRAGGARVTAVGTVFDVRRAADEVRVVLVSGVVDVSGADRLPPLRLRAGHQARVSDAAILTSAVDVDAATGWTEGRVVFRDTPLAQAVAEVNRYLTHKIELDAPSLEGEPVNGVFKTGDREAFVSAASDTLGLRSSEGANGAVRLSAQK